MAKFPQPPGVAALRKKFPATFTLPTDTQVFRVFRSRSQHPVNWDTFRYFGPTSARFDHHLPDGDGESTIGHRGILYGAFGSNAIPTCLAEVYQGARTIDRRDGSPVMCAFRTTQPLALLDLTGTFTTRIGASMAISTGPRGRARLWARQLYEAYPHAHGIYFGSSMHGNNPSVALFERSSFAIPDHPSFHRQLADPQMENIVRRTAGAIGYTVV